ncbi:helix-turn-helix domain-containing protein [Streptomyces cinereoruber]|uniref:helix-turn-helix domain-containing protein n=1 Tax=Streptomyces cinereoruber TaxID=67260 RepID=UPI003634D147
MMSAMEPEWGKLGARLRAGRETLRMSQEDVGDRIGVKRNTLRLIENGRISRVSATVRAYARLIGWTDDSVDTVLNGGEPQLAEGGPAATKEAPKDFAAEVARVLMSRLPARIVQEVIDGRVVEHDVLDLRPDGSSALMTLIVERSQEPPASQVQEDLRNWGEVQRELRRLLKSQDE